MGSEDIIEERRDNPAWNEFFRASGRFPAYLAEVSLSAIHLAGWLGAIVAAIAIGMSKTGFSGVGLVGIVLLAQILPARESTGAILPMLIVADIFAVRIYHQHARGALGLRLLGPALIGIVGGWLLMPHLSNAIFGPLIGWIALGLIVLAIVQRFVPGIVTVAIKLPAVAWIFGIGAGVTTMVANAAGVVMSIYFLAHRLPKMEFVGTTAWFFLALNLLKVPFSVSLGLINPTSLLFDLTLVPAVIAGVLLGRWLLKKINQTFFEWMVIGFALLSALRLLLR